MKKILIQNNLLIKKKENERLFIETGLFNLIPTVFEYDDVFKGSFKDSEFEIIELLASNRYKNNSIICFEGVIVKININKNIKAETIIRTKDIFWSLLGFEHIVLEDTEFNNNFNVYSEDEVEARYLITTSFMDRLNNLKNTFDVKKMSCAFYEKYFLIAFYDNKDAFRFGTFDTSLLDHKEFSRLTKEIMSIYEMIDCFKFGEKTRI